MQTMANTDRAREALNAIPADIPRDAWVKVGMAAQAAGLEFDDFRDWSAQAPSFNERDAQDTWRSFQTGKGIGAGTLFKTAAENGWRFDSPRAANSPILRAQKGPLGPAKVVSRGPTPAEVWERCQPAGMTHPYITAKNGEPDGLRVVPDDSQLRVAGESMAGALVVPVVQKNGSLSTVQFIAPPATAERLKAMGRPGKLNLPGHSLQGWFVVGTLEDTATCYVCEGLGQAWAAWKATGSPAVVSFGWGRVRAVAAELRTAHPRMRLVIVPDAGKEGAAEEVAGALRVGFVPMPAGWPANSDINDMAQRDGLDAVKALLCAAKAPEQRYRLLGASDLLAMPAMPWRIRGVLPARGIAALFGPSASGKSFLALDMAAAIAGGQRWFGCRVSAAPVVYLALEGEGGFRARVQGWQMHRGESMPDSLRLMLQPFALTEPQDVEDLAAVIPQGAVVYVDTLNRAAPTADENASKDMGLILEAVKRLQALTDGLVVLVHHTGKDATKGLRGHSSLFAAMDAAIEVCREGDRREWRVAKSKDGEDGASKAFRLQVETLGADEHGDAVTSCVVVPDTAAEDVQRVKMPTGGNQRIAWDVLKPMFKTGELGKPGAPGMKQSIELETAIAKVSASMTCESHRRATRAREAITGLIGRGVLGCHEGWVWQC